MSASVRRFIPYSSWDNIRFWIDKEVYGRDFPTFEEASDYGGFQVKDDAAENALYKKLGRALTTEEVWFSSEYLTQEE